eukprot:2142373-Pyramimonas_sp.AAC.1
MQHVGWETLLADPADSSVAVVNFVTARYLCASMSLDNYAGELFGEIFSGHNEIDLANWLGMPIAGQPADIAFVENIHVPAEVDHEMTGAPADS